MISEVMAQDDDMVNFCTYISEHEVDWNLWKTFHMTQFDAIDKAELQSKNLTIFLSPTGKTAWFSDITDWNLVIQDDCLQLDHIRITGVLEKRKNIWKIVQIHACVPQQ